LVRDQADRDAISSRLMRYRDQNGEDWADIIDMLTLHPEEPRKVVRVLGEIEAAEQREEGGPGGRTEREVFARGSRPPVTLGPPHLQATELYGKETGKAFV
jgi:hypothetical protein